MKFIIYENVLINHCWVLLLKHLICVSSCNMQQSLEINAADSSDIMQHAFRSIRKPTFTLINVFTFSVVHLERDVVIEHSCTLNQRFWNSYIHLLTTGRIHLQLLAACLLFFCKKTVIINCAHCRPEYRLLRPPTERERERGRELENECGRSLGTRRNFVCEFSQISQCRWSVFTNLHVLTKYRGNWL